MLGHHNNLWHFGICGPTLQLIPAYSSLFGAWHWYAYIYIFRLNIVILIPKIKEMSEETKQKIPKN
jgi:hypothetical protein